MEEHLLQTYPLWEWNTVLSHCVSSMPMKDRRLIFHQARLLDVHAAVDLFFPQYGITFGEFAVWNTVVRRSKTTAPSLEQEE